MDDAPVSPEEVAHRGFGTAFRGFDTAEVRAYLQRVANELRASVARERELHRRLADAEHRAAHPVLEGEALTRALGDEMARILATAQQAAQDLRSRAEENAARILRDAHEQAQRIRAEAEGVLARRSEEAEAQATEIRGAAEGEAAAILATARRDAAAAMEDVENRARQVVHEAQAARSRVVADLTRRRRIVQAQVDQLRAGRDRLLDAYRVVRRTLDEVADELERVEEEARAAAEAAGERAEPEKEENVDVLAAFPAAAAPGAPVPVEPPAPAPRRAPEPPPPPPPPPAPAPAAVSVPEPVEADGPADGAAGGAGTPSPAAPPPEVDELFARIRAGRAEAVVRAEEVLARDAGTGAEGREAAATPEPGPQPSAEDAAGDESALQRRDAALEGIEATLARKLKRALQDEQNEVLDRLRSRRAGEDPSVALPPADEQARRYGTVAADLLRQAAGAGARFVAPRWQGRADVDDVVAELAQSLAGALHRALAGAVTDERDAEETSVLMERIGAAYRGFKSQRVEGLAGDSITAAFGRGVLAVSGPESPLQWVVDDEGRPCPDCDDNALAGPTRPGDPFPTGQPHPPAHAGCRCMLAPARLAAAVAEAG